MPYNSFTLPQLMENFGIEETTFSFIPANIPAVEISQHLLDDLSQVVGLALASEKAKSEHIVAPVLKEFRTKNREHISYFSGYQFEVDVEKKLNGYCDFIFSLAPYKQSISAPIFFVVEAKKDEIEEAWGQCGAEMYAAQVFNEKHHRPPKTIYGCVTNAFSWAFLKLEGKILYIDPNYIPLTFAAPHKVLAVLQWILAESLHEKEGKNP